MTLGRIRFGILLALFAASCMTANENTPCEEITKTVHDTVRVEFVKRDTLRIKDTVKVQIVKKDTIILKDTVTITKRDTIKQVVRDTLIKRDTLRIRDTIKTVVRDTLRIHDTTTVTVHDTILASLPDPNNLFGVWEGQASGQKVVLAFTTSVINQLADFSANVGATSTSGYIAQLDSVQAKVKWSFHDVTWLMDLRNGVLTIQEIGDMMFPGGNAILRKR